MKTAAEKFLGEHDFRNFCKMDAGNVHNYRRHIISFEILPFDERFSTLCPFFYLLFTFRERINKLTSVIFLNFDDALTYFLSWFGRNYVIVFFESALLLFL